MPNIANGGASNLLIDDFASSDNGFVGPGFAPLGAVLAIMPTGYAQAFLPPVGQIVDGWLRCEGTSFQRTINAPTSPMHGQVVPDLSGGVFLAGSTSSGSTSSLGAGATTTTLATNNIASHNHGFCHSHSNTMSWGSPSNPVSHFHYIGWSGNTSAGVCKFYYNNHNAGTSAGVNDQTGWTGGPYGDYVDTSYPAAAHVHNFSIGYIGTGGPSITMNHNHGVTKSGSIGTATLTAAACGNTTTYSKMPTYIDVMFIMRVL